MLMLLTDVLQVLTVCTGY